MRRQVWKFELSLDGETSLAMPPAAPLCVVQQQGEQLWLWAEIDKDVPWVTRKFEVFGTGWNIPNGAQYVGTIFTVNFVWHVYELHEQKPELDAEWFENATRHKGGIDV